MPRLYTAYFGRVPDESGFDFWNSNFSGGERNLEQISEFFAAEAEFNSLYGSLDDEAFISLVYQNVMSRDADPAGQQYWGRRLTDGSLSRGQVMTFFSENEEYVIQTNTAVPAAGYFSWYPVGTTWTCSNSTETVSRTNDPYADLILINSGSDTKLVLVQLIDVLTGGNQRFRLKISMPGIGLSELSQAGTDFKSFKIWGEGEVSWALVQYPTSIGIPTQRGGWGTNGRPVHYPTH